MIGVLLLGVLLQAADTDGQVLRFLEAEGVEAKREAAKAIVAAGAGFDEVHAALVRGRTYGRDVPRGHLVKKRVSTNGLLHPYVVLVPEDYTPEKRWPVRMDLHGGMGVQGWDADAALWHGGWSRASGQIMIFPAGWWDSMWWEHSQSSNLEAILAEVKREYNVDENRVHLQGNSDGGIATFFYAFRQPDRWSGYVGFVCSPDRLVREELRPDGQMHLSNLRDQRFHLGYGERDRKAPVKHLRRYLELFAEHGAELDYYIKPRKGHSLHLTDDEVRRMYDFVAKSVRDPLPDRISWSTERTDRYHRRSWVVIEEIDTTKAPTKAERENLLPRWGIPIQMKGPTVRPQPYGRVDVERNGNTIEVTTHRVERLRLLLSPAEFDFDAPIVVHLDGEEVHRDVLTPSVATLLEWAAIDDDRTLLFGAELVLEP